MVKKQEGTESSDQIDELIKNISKSFAGFASRGDVAEVKKGILSTGIPSLDKIMGGGYRKGASHLFTGDSMSGKTLISYFGIIQAQQKGEIAVLVDMENCYDPEWAKKIGIDTNKLVVIKPESGESAVDTVVELIRNKVGMVVLDSNAALLPLAESEGDAEQQFMGIQARLINKLYRKITPINTDTVFIATNQLRQKIGDRFHPGVEDVLPGGKGQVFYSHLMLKITRKGSLVRKSVKGEDTIVSEDSGSDKKKEGVKVGHNLELFTAKCKFYPAYQSCVIPFNFYTGQLDHLSSLIEVAIDEDIIHRLNSLSYEFNGTKIIGRQGLTDYFNSKPEETELLKNLVTQNA